METNKHMNTRTPKLAVMLGMIAFSGMLAKADTTLSGCRDFTSADNGTTGSYNSFLIPASSNFQKTDGTPCFKFTSVSYVDLHCGSGDSLDIATFGAELPSSPNSGRYGTALQITDSAYVSVRGCKITNAYSNVGSNSWVNYTVGIYDSSSISLKYVDVPTSHFPSDVNTPNALSVDTVSYLTLQNSFFGTQTFLYGIDHATVNNFNVFSTPSLDFGYITAPLTIGKSTRTSTNPSYNTVQYNSIWGNWNHILGTGEKGTDDCLILQLCDHCDIEYNYLAGAIDAVVEFIDANWATTLSNNYLADWGFVAVGHYHGMAQDNLTVNGNTLCPGSYNTSTYTCDTSTAIPLRRYFYFTPSSVLPTISTPYPFSVSFTSNLVVAVPSSTQANQDVIDISFGGRTGYSSSASVTMSGNTFRQGPYSGYYWFDAIDTANMALTSAPNYCNNGGHATTMNCSGNW